MNVQTDTIVLKARADATPDFLAQIKSKDSCAGTFHKVGEYELPCLSGGMLCRSYEQRRYTMPHDEHKEAVGVLVDTVKKLKDQMEFGEENPRAVVETVVCQPKALMSCPCATAEKINEYDKALLLDLGIESMPKLRKEDQQIGLDAFKNDKRNLFIYGDSGGGKTVLAAACALGYHRKVKVLIGAEIQNEWRRKNLNSENLDYSGLLILDDASQTTPSEFFKEQLWYVLDRVVKKKLRCIITSNISPEAFGAKYTNGKDEAQSLINRLAKFEAIEL